VVAGRPSAVLASPKRVRISVIWDALSVTPALTASAQVTVVRLARVLRRLIASRSSVTWIALTKVVPATNGSSVKVGDPLWNGEGEVLRLFAFAPSLVPRSVRGESDTDFVSSWRNAGSSKVFFASKSLGGCVAGCSFFAENPLAATAVRLP
jgi:hypothetical protein